jgi:LmbE family N-acetylglucosaminyl deacetylase
LKSAPQIRIAEQKRANRLINIEKSFFLNFKDGHLSHCAALVTKIEKVINSVEPNLILSHGINDSHQDHSAVSKATLSATRKSNSSILFYPFCLCREPFAANLYVDITKYFPEKLKILRLFDSQKNSRYMKESFIKTVARETGLSINCLYAEKFIIYFSAI